VALVLDWLELAVRWVHVIAGVAWIGASFYFNWLNDRLTAPETPEPGLVGELWSVHGGGFYRALKYDTVPGATLSHLHWFKWEAYLTWLSGFALLVLVYYLGADVYLIDPTVAALPSGAAIGISLGGLALGWLVYDRLCRTALAQRPAVFIGLGLVLIAGAAFGFQQVFGPRAAYMQIGAMLGTIMAANVFFMIIPAHVELVKAVEEGRAPDTATGSYAAGRSRHNNYFTLPVLFVMISGHHPMTYGHPWGWAILIGLFIVGVLTRHGFNQRNRGRPPGWLFAAALLGLLALAVVSTGARGRIDLGAGPPGAVTYAEIEEILVARCVTCHAAEPAHRLFDEPPGGILLETEAQVRAVLSKIEAVTVHTRIMPLGNFTGMTDEERAVLAAWIRSGVDR